MSDYYQELAQKAATAFGEALVSSKVEFGELTLEVAPANLIAVATGLRDGAEFACEELIDLCGADYSEYDHGSWSGERFAVIYHLLSVSKNHRIRLRCFAEGELPRVESVVDVWNSANWYEREAFDMYGIVFDGHPDLRRILTDYGFIGHPFRKDFPISGNVEMRYDPELRRVVYEPVTIDPRNMVPQAFREDHRYLAQELGGDKRG